MRIVKSMLRNVTLNKKGSLFDYISIIPAIFTGAIMVILVIFMIKTLNAQNFFGMSTASQAVGSSLTAAIPTFDFIILAGYMGLFLGSVVLAFGLPTNPSFFWLNMLLLGIMLFFAVALSNTWEALQAISQLGTAFQETNVTNFIFSKLPLLTTIYGIVLTVVMLGIKKVAAEEEVDLL